ncbi:hypothetical protein GUITHDRAFT_103198 [Guillardia theta CCMP2712]|uniref:Uncharacterized protein n=1 Tax=Guillardia theta (strain CCMP2712) TaxID=905079 RepID=L1JRW3_GUITC|nr:hypothetical protein GUITHDRAFT_103198 [Guillardia theta CCMP2712]EKX51281.1 hypothetical protein GUITHDRAFT_103198 [Guillardia theta CCMP2712]|eukprot:XP_005838261.1 hypothetical protein GUITHDRAFT_103198 [Guillardia theta CCMP2712]
MELKTLDEPAELSEDDLSSALLKKISLSERRNNSLQERIRELEKELVRVKKTSLISRNNQWLYFCNVCRRKTNQANLRIHFAEWKETTIVSVSFVRIIFLQERFHKLKVLYKHFFHWFLLSSQSSSNHHFEPWEAQEGLPHPPSPQPPAQTHAVDSDTASSIADANESKERSRWEELNTSRTSLEKKPRAGLAKLWGMETANTTEFM